MAHLKRVYLEDVPQHIITKFNFTLTPIILQLQNHIDDFTGRLLGSNPPTYGTRPAESSMIKEWIHTFGKAPTVHSCYGTGAASPDCYLKYGAPKTIDIPSTNK